ncbi:PAS domain-containing protein [Rudanella paleaurantiibacter]|uniref:histidine kinase n=1 Tax=Rudanella paleaurantiibacter TaxID=2614655 RepID=A0A7J5TSV2_9BACT|nr:PAS domain-containing protein [Rudanella paleaurantiibacter]KAB7726506.1 PAS domain-containing protein [Rudanella paleaurantiibacter]
MPAKKIPLSDERYTANQLFDKSPLAIAIVSHPSGKLIYTNPIFENVYDLKSSTVGQTVKDVWTSNSQTVLLSLIEEAYLSGQPAMLAEYRTYNNIEGVSQRECFQWTATPVQTAYSQDIQILLQGVAISRYVEAPKLNDSNKFVLNPTNDYFALSINTGNVGTWYWEVEKDELTWSQEQLNIYGIEPAEFGGNFSSFFSFLFEEDKSRILNLTECHNTSAGEYEYQFRIRRKDGSLRWIQARSRTCFDQHGKIKFIIGTNFDITEQKLTEEQLRQSQKRVQLAMEAGNMYFWEIDLQTGQSIWSDNTARILGIASDYLPKTLTDAQRFNHPEDSHEVQELFSRVLKGEVNKIAYEQRIIHPINGSTIWLQVQGIVEYTEGNAVRLIGVSENISQKKEVQQALLNQQKFTQSVLEASPSLTYIFDLTTRSNTYVSNQITDILGYTAEEISAKGDALLSTLLHPQDISDANKRFQQFLEQEENDVLSAEYRMQHKSGNWIWLYDRARVFQRDIQGTPIQILGVATDITERKQLEKELQEQFDELQNIYQNAPMGLAVVDRELRFLRANDRLAEINGLSIEEHLGNTITDIVPDLAGQVSTILQHVFQTGQPLLNIELNGYTKAEPNKERYWMESWYPLKNGKGDTFAVSVVVEETTERKRAEAEINSLREQLELTIENIPAEVYVFDASRQIRLSNRAARENIHQLTGEYNELGTGLPFLLEMADQKFLYFDENNNPLSSDQTCTSLAFQTARESQAVVKRVEKNNNATKWLMLHSTPLLDETGCVRLVITTATDITATKQAHVLVEESEARFRIVADATPTMVWALHPDGTSKYANKCVLQYFGITEKQYYQASQLDWVHPDDIQQARIAFANGLQHQQAFDVEYRLRRYDGIYHWFLVRVRPSFYPTGELYGFVGSSTDFTDQKQSSLRLELAQKVGRAGFFEWNLLTNKLHVTGILKELLNTVTGLVNLTDWTGRLVPEDYERTRTVLDEAIAQRKTQLTYDLRVQVEDKIRWLAAEATINYNTEGKAIQILGINYDVTDRKQIELALQESEALFRRMSDDSPVWVWRVDSQIRANYANWSMVTYLGLSSPQEFSGYIWEGLTHPDDLITVYETFTEAVKNQQPFSFESRVKNSATGQYEWCLFKGVPNIHEGSFIGFIGTGIHIHHQKTFAEQLEKEVTQRTAELMNVNGELRRSNEYLQQFAYVASHDLQEPLRKIQSFGDILSKQFGQVLSEDGLDLLYRMQNAAKRMSQLVKDLLSYSRLSTHQQPKRPIAISELIKSVLSDFELLIEQTHASITIRELPTIIADPFQIQQLFSNLIGNALKYVAEGTTPEIVLNCRVIPVEQIDLTLISSRPDTHQLTPCYYEFTITDNGIGFDEQYLDRIFGMFQRLVGKSQYEGSGMGLAICKRVIDNHRGFITARSQPGKGSTFIVYLPQSDD